MAMFHLNQPNILGICEYGEYFQSFSPGGGGTCL